MSENTYTIDMVSDILGKKETYVFTFPYYHTNTDEGLYIMFANILSTEDGLTTVTLSTEQEDAVRDDIAVLLRSNDNED